MGKTLNQAKVSDERSMEGLSKGQLFGALFGVAVGVIIFLLPLGLERTASAVLALSAWLLIWLIFRPIESGYTGLIFILFLTLLKFPPAGIFTWFTISPGWFQISAFVIAATMVKSGLAKRFAYTLMYKLGANTVPRFLLISVVVVFLMILLVPSPTALIAIMFPLAIFVAEAWNLPKRSEDKKGVPPLALISFFLLILCGQAGTWVKTGFSLNLLTMALSRVDIEWMDWFILAAPLVWVFGFLSVFFLLKVYRPSKEVVAPKEVLKAKYDELGSLTGKEKGVLVVMLIVLILWITEKSHGIATGWVALGAMCVFAIPRFRIFKNFDEAISSINWSVMFFITALSAMSSVLNSSGASVVIQKALSVIQPDTVTGYYLLSSLLGTFATSVFGINMMQGVFIPVFVEWSQALGMGTSQGLLAVWLPSVLGGNLIPVLLPSVLFAWTFKYKGERLFTFADGFKVTLVAYVAYYIVAFVSQMTYWKLF